MTSDAPTSAEPSLRGRPVVTSHAAIEQAAFQLFGQLGFERTTMDAIAREVGVSKRTLFRYYASKNDIPWGQFTRTLSEFRRVFEEVPPETPVHLAVQEGILRFNTFPAEAKPSHRDRMRLILTTPELQAHSVLRYAEWRAVIAEYVAGRYDCKATDLGPSLAGHISLAIALASYEEWLAMPSGDLITVLERALGELRRYIES